LLLRGCLLPLLLLLLLLCPTGCVPAVIGIAPSGAVFYGVYDLLKSNHLASLSQPAAHHSRTAAAAAGRTRQQQ